MTCASPVVLTRLAIEPGASPHTFDTSSERYDFYVHTVQNINSIVHASTIRGTRSEAAERSRQGPSFIAGTLSIPVDGEAMVNWLPRILGANASGTTFALAETLQSFGGLIDLGGNTHQLKDLQIARATFSGEAFNGGETPQPLRLDLSIQGIAEATGTSFPAISLSTSANTAPYIFEDGSWTIESSTRNVMKFRLTIDNFLRARWSMGSLVPTCLYPAGRRVTAQAIVPYTSTDASGLYGASYSGAASTLTFTNGGLSLAFSMPALQNVTNTPVASGRGEVVLALQGIARKSGSTAELTVTNDSTP